MDNDNNVTSIFAKMNLAAQHIQPTTPPPRICSAAVINLHYDLISCSLIVMYTVLCHQVMSANNYLGVSSSMRHQCISFWVSEFYRFKYGWIIILKHMDHFDCFVCYAYRYTTICELIGKKELCSRFMSFLLIKVLL